MINHYSNRHVLITGGLGFIGSNLARALVAQGAVVTLVDSLIPEYGGNPFNIVDIRDRLLDSRQGLPVQSGGTDQPSRFDD